MKHSCVREFKNTHAQRSFSSVVIFVDVVTANHRGVRGKWLECEETTCCRLYGYKEDTD